MGNGRRKAIFGFPGFISETWVSELNLPGPQKRGTGGTLDVDKFDMGGPGPPARVRGTSRLSPVFRVASGSLFGTWGFRPVEPAHRGMGMGKASMWECVKRGERGKSEGFPPTEAGVGERPR